MEKKKERLINFINTDPRQNFNKNWKFYLGDQPKAWTSTFPDDDFERVDLPHDYSIGQDYSPYFEAESAYKPGGVATYRKAFVLDGIDLRTKQVFVYFDGVYHKSTSFINDHKLGFNPYGYNSFAYDLTPYLKTEGENILAVHLDHQVPSSRWYSGSGIYRSVDILVKDRLNFGIYGPFVSYDLKVKNAEIFVKATINNAYDQKQDFKVCHRLYDKDKLKGEVQSEILTVGKNKSIEASSNFLAENLKVWDLENPKLYQLVSEIIVGDEVKERVFTDIGFRKITKDPKTGIALNGKNIKIKGVCLHHDQGALGACDYYASIERQVDILKDMGANTIRLAHNPASRNLIDICNKKGMLVVSEIFDGWILDKNNNYNDFSQFFEKEIGKSDLVGSGPEMIYAEFSLRQILMRDYNSPALIMTSIGNEILEGTDWSRLAHYPKVAENIIKWIRELNPQTWITIGDNIIRYEYRDELVEIDQMIHEAGGLVGLNYTNDSRYDHIHQKFPDWILWASETASSINSRSVYDRFELDNLPKDRKLSSYDTSKVGWGKHASDAWYEVISRDFVAGEAVWTGFDYLGEPTPFNGIDRGTVDGWPSPRSSYFGILDLAGFAKDSYYFYRSVWQEADTTLHLVGNLNEGEIAIENGKIRVDCYTNAPSVELVFIDDEGEITSLARQSFIPYTTKAGHSYQRIGGKDAGPSLYMSWQIPFAKGSIKAIAYDTNNRIITETIGRNIIKTTGPAHHIRASVNKASIQNDSYDLAHITINICDKDGNLVESADNQIDIEVTSNGKVVAMDNGFQEDMTAFNLSSKKAYAGKVLAIIAAKTSLEPIEVIIKSEGLVGTSFCINVEESSTNYNIRPTDTKEKSAKLDLKYPIKDYKILNYTCHSLPNIYPKLPGKLELVSKKGKLTGIFVDIDWDEIKADELAQEGNILVKGHGTIEGLNLEAHAFVRIEGEKEKINRDISDLALIKEKDKNILYFGFATQQLFGEIRIKNTTDPQVKIYFSETMTREESDLLTYEISEKDGDLIYKFKAKKATYISLVFENNPPALADIGLFTVQKQVQIHKSTDFSYMKIDDYDLTPDELMANEFKMNKPFESLSYGVKDNAAVTVVESKKKLSLWLVSEDSKTYRKFVIRK